MKRITCDQVERFIENGMRRELQKDLHNLKMIKEAEFQSCAYYHLRKFLRGDKRWRVCTERYVPTTKHYVDILIFCDKSPAIAIELKWNSDRLRRKDRHSLHASLTKLRVSKAYFVTTRIDQPEYKERPKHGIEKNRLVEFTIPLGLSGSKFERWKDERKLYRGRMTKADSE